MGGATDHAGLRHAPGRAVLYMLVAIAMLALLDAGVKWLTADYAVPQIAFIRYLFGIVLAILLAGRMGGLATLKTRRPLGHALRSAFNLATMLLFYFALELLPLADTIAIAFAGPLFMTALSVVLLKERVGPRRWAAVIVGLLGVVLILQPSGTGFTLGAFYAIAAAFLYALTLITSRQLSTTESSPAILFYYSIGVLVMTGGAGLLGEAGIVPRWAWPPLKLADLWIFAVVGISGSFGQFFLNQAFRYGEVSLLAPIEYTALFWGILYGIILWGDIPSWMVLGGAAIIAGSSLYIAHREAQLRRAAIARDAIAKDAVPPDEGAR
jgi:drug/metabolite transporter (DMT)-like permease